MNKGISTAIAFLCLGCLCAAQTFDKEQQRELVVIESNHEFDFNPHTASYASEAQILNSTHEGLFTYHPYSLEAEPALAESFRISRDRLLWTFTIRENARFSNGESITAQTIRESWLALLKNPDASFSSLLDCIAGAEEYRTGKTATPENVGIVAQNERTLQIKLAAPTEYLSKILCHHAFAAVKSDPKLASGPYMLSSVSNEEIILKKNPQYRDAQNVAIPSVKILLSDDMEKNTYLFNVGKADWVTADIDTQRIFDIGSIKLSPQFGTEYLFFKAKGALVNEKVRNALVTALPWDELRKSAFIKAETFVLRLPGYPGVDGRFGQNIIAAKKLLAESGVDPKTISITIDMPNVPLSLEKAELLKNAWQELGVTTFVKAVPPSRYINTIRKSDSDVFSYIWIGDYADPTAFLELFKGNSTLNESGWKNSEYDALLFEASKIADTVQRYEKLAEAEQVLLDSGMIMPVSHTVSFNVIDSGSIEGWYDNALNIHPYRFLKFVQPKPIQNLVQQHKRH